MYKPAFVPAPSIYTLEGQRFTVCMNELTTSCTRKRLLQLHLFTHWKDCNVRIIKGHHVQETFVPGTSRNQTLIALR